MPLILSYVQYANIFILFPNSASYVCTEDEGLGLMNKKNVEIIHTKPRGKGQCSPEQTYGGTPSFCISFGYFLDVYFCLFGQRGLKSQPISF